jgi:hypothetical protein
MLNLQFDNGKPLNIESAIFEIHVVHAAGEMQPIGNVPNNGCITVISKCTYGIKKYKAVIEPRAGEKLRIKYRGHQRTIKLVKICDHCGCINNHNREACRICQKQDFGTFVG